MPTPSSYPWIARVVAGLSLLAPAVAGAPSPAVARTARAAGAAPAAGCGDTVPLAGQPAARVRAVTLCALNVQRRQAGLSPLRPVRALTRLAQAHTASMVSHHVLTHGDVRRRLRAYTAGHGSYLLGENVGTVDAGDRSGPTVAEMVAAWMRSPPHRANILDGRFRDVGVGLMRLATDGRPGVTFTTSFGRRG